MRRIALAALLCSCAHHASPSTNASLVAKSPARERALAFLEQNCNSCHDGDEKDRPAIGASHPLPKALAMRSVLMLASNRMPLDSARLAEPARREGIRLLCEAAADDPLACVTSSERRNPAALVAPPQQMLDAVARAYPNDAPDGTAAKLLRAHAVAASGLSLRDDPTTELALALLVAERCPRDPSAFEACARFVLDHARFTQPAVTP